MGENMKDKRIGEVRYNRFNTKMTLIEYINAKDIVIQFDNGYKIHRTYKSFDEGRITSVYDKTIYNIGYIGHGEYNTSTKDKKHTKSYTKWYDMFTRCYNDSFHKTNPNYIGCTVCEEWHNFQNFAKWFDDNYYEIDDCNMQLDKDILIKGNKLYSPETCCIIPKDINGLFVKSNRIRGDLPIGVTIDDTYRNKKYLSQCKIGNKKHINLGYYYDKFEAFNAYKQFKESYIKQVANKYKNKIPDKIYNVMINYKVEITD